MRADVVFKIQFHNYYGYLSKIDYGNAQKADFRPDFSRADVVFRAGRCSFSRADVVFRAGRCSFSAPYPYRILLEVLQNLKQNARAREEALAAELRPPALWAPPTQIRFAPVKKDAA